MFLPLPGTGPALGPRHSCAAAPGCQNSARKYRQWSPPCYPGGGPGWCSSFCNPHCGPRPAPPGYGFALGGGNIGPICALRGGDAGLIAEGKGLVGPLADIHVNFRRGRGQPPDKPCPGMADREGYLSQAAVPGFQQGLHHSGVAAFCISVMRVFLCSRTRLIAARVVI